MIRMTMLMMIEFPTPATVTPLYCTSYLDEWLMACVSVSIIIGCAIAFGLLLLCVCIVATVFIKGRRKEYVLRVLSTRSWIKISRQSAGCSSASVSWLPQTQDSNAPCWPYDPAATITVHQLMGSRIICYQHTLRSKFSHNTRHSISPKARCWPNREFFIRHLHSTLPLWGSSRNIATSLVRKTRMVDLPGGENTRLDTIRNVTDTQTDGQTTHDSKGCACSLAMPQSCRKKWRC